MTYNVGHLLELAGVSDSTLNKYAKLAGVQTPKRGKRNHHYTGDEARAILKTIVATTSDSAVRARCREALAELQKPNTNGCNRLPAALNKQSVPGQKVPPW